MSFQTLEDRFIARARGIYNKFSNSEQLQPVKPDFPRPSTAIRNDSRLFPFESTKRDISFLTKYITSPRGREQFVAKQFLLQKTNTFAQTRFYNPAGALLSAPPIVSFPRHIGPGALNAINTGALQTETVESVNSPARGLGARLLGGLGRIVDFNPFNDGPTKVGLNNQYYQRPEDIVFYGIGGLGPRLPVQQSVDTRGQKRGMKYPENQENFTTSTIKKQTFSFPTKNSQVYARRQSLLNKLTREVKETKIKPVLNTAKYSTSNGTDFVVSGSQLKDVNISELSSMYDEKSNQYVQQTKTFLGITAILYENPYGLDSSKKFTIGPVADNDNSTLATDSSKKSSLRDSFNTSILGDAELQQVSDRKLVYSTLSNPPSSQNKDIINFIFTANGEAPVRFRAFISELSEQIETEYNEDRYLGRTERFVTYAGAKRSVKLKFMIVAFSEDEIDNVWLRMNYLSGLAFPKGASPSGFMIPPLFKITIGHIYENQPTYIKSLDYVFIDDKMTFDIDAQVPQRIEVQMQLQLLEKATRFYDSPFYAISEKLKDRTTRVRFKRASERLNSLDLGLED